MMPEGNPLRIAFIGAGGVNFGGVDPGSPWDHASRLEQLAGEIPLIVVGVADPDEKRGKFVLEQRRQGARPGIWTSAQWFAGYQEMLDTARPTAVFIGVPPMCHGELELACARAGAHMLIEKPIHSGSPELTHRVRDVLASEYPHLVVSVAYMLRYSKAVQHVKALLAQHKAQPVSVIARYNSAYTSIPKPMFWDRRKSGGPVVEQGTHFVDLLRFFGGDPEFSTIQAVCVRAAEPAGQLRAVPERVEDGLEEHHRIDRATQAMWQFEDSGAIGSLMHAVLMHGTKYHTEFEIWCDGLRILLHNPYTDECYVAVNSEPPIHFRDDDYYLTEDRAFLQAVQTGDCSGILSPYHDAVRTHELAYAIATKCEPTAN